MTQSAKSVARGITARYLVALCLVAGLSTTAYLMLSTVIRAEEHRTAVLNLAANQRTLSQRIAFFANAYSNADNDLDRDDYRRELRRSIKTMAGAHDTLTLRARDFGLSSEMIAMMDGIYFDGANPFDLQVRKYLDHARAVLKAPESELTPENYNLIALNLAGTNYILQTHDLIVSLLQRDGEESIARLEKLETALWLAALLLLFSEATLIFRPMARQVTRTVRELEDARQCADAASEAKSAFLRNMSHEIRTPMNAILGMTELLRRTDLSEHQKRYADHVLDAGNHLLDLLNDILDLNRLEAGKVVIENHPFALAQEIEAVTGMLRSVAKQKGLELGITVDPELPASFEGDATRLRQVLVNLVGNAIKFTHAGRIDVIAARGPAEAGQTGRIHLRLEVRDMGIGIPAEKQTAIFGEFEQADASTTREFGGTGLGLAICKHIVGLMGGSIGVQSTEGAGSTFWLDLPLRPLPAPMTPDRTADAPQSAVPRSGIKVLVAEDNAANRIVIEGLLEGLGAEVRLAADGAEAVAAIERHGADLVLMDINMPVLDGIGATRAIRTLCPPLSQVPIVALTAHAMPGDGDRLLGESMNDYLPKPVRDDDLRRVLARWAGGPAAPTGTEPAEGEPTAAPVLDTAAFEVLAQKLGTERLRKVVESTLPAFEEAKACLEEAIARSDTQMAADAIHGIRGSAATLGARRLAELAGRIESELGAGLMTPETGDALTREVKAAAAKLQERIAS